MGEGHLSTMLMAALVWAGVLAVGVCRADDWRGQWPGRQQADAEIVRYFHQRARAKVEALRRRLPPERFIETAEAVRAALKATYRMPEVVLDQPSTLVRETCIDGIPVEVRLRQVLPGVYSTSWVYRPLGEGPRHPAVLYLPGHADPAWDPVIQKRCLGFAKQGYVAMTVEPLGQTELTDTPLRNEYHGCGSMAYLLTTRQSLLGVIMAGYAAELGYLRSRGDVDPDQVTVMGGSMGGTHALWLAAIDQRVKAVVAVSAAPLVQPDWCLRMHCLCDLMVGLHDAADAELIRALIAPRPLMVIYPDLEAPLTEKGALLLGEGRLDFMDKAAKSRYFLSEEDMRRVYPYARDVYRLRGVPDRFVEVVVAGPHGDAPQYRELAYGWFAHFLMGRESAAAIPEASLAPISDPEQAQTTLRVWPDGGRPRDLLGPTAYAQRETSALIARLPAPPRDARSARRLGAQLRRKVGALLTVYGPQQAPEPLDEGVVNVDGTPAGRYLVEPEPGARVHVLAFRPSPTARPSGRLYLLLHPQGVAATAGSGEWKRLTDEGSWVICADLRGMGSSPSLDGAYVGLRDQSLCVGALKLGETVAGWWVTDLLALVAVAPKITGGALEVTVRGERELGLVAILAASGTPAIKAVETRGLPASYHSAGGYGRPYAWGESAQDLGGYGSMVPCLPGVLEFADVPQLAALACPRPLTITAPLWASGEAVAERDLARAFAWTRRFYEASGCADSFVVNHGGGDG